MIFRSAKIATSRAALAAMTPPPRVVVEFGTFVGTSAIAWAAMLRDFHGSGDAEAARAAGVRVFTFEFDPAVAEVARSLVAAAGVDDVVEVHVGAGADSLRRLHAEGRVRAGEVDVVFIDHWEECYLPDLRLCEELGLFRAGSLVLADNTDMPGAPDYLAYVKKGGEGPVRYESESLQSESAHGPVRCCPVLWGVVALFLWCFADGFDSLSSRSAKWLPYKLRRTRVSIKNKEIKNKWQCFLTMY